MNITCFAFSIASDTALFPVRYKIYSQVKPNNLPAIIMAVDKEFDLRIMTHRGKGVVSMQLGLEIMFALFFTLLLLFSRMKEMNKLVSNSCTKVAYE